MARDGATGALSGGGDPRRGGSVGARMSTRAIDFEAEGLLDGVEGDARAARLELLERLRSEGVSLEELREAVAAARLTLLPVERALAGDGPRYSPREIAELSGVDLDLLQRATAALGIPYPGPRQPDPDRGRARGGPPGARRSSTPACPRTASSRWRGRSGPAPRGSPPPTGS